MTKKELDEFIESASKEELDLFVKMNLFKQFQEKFSTPKRTHEEEMKHHVKNILFFQKKLKNKIPIPELLNEIINKYK